MSSASGAHVCGGGGGASSVIVPSDRPLAVLYRIHDIHPHPLSEWWYAAEAGREPVTLSRASRVVDGDMVVVITAGAHLPEAQPWTKSITIYGQPQVHRWAIPAEQIMHLYVARWQVEGEDVSHILQQTFWSDALGPDDIKRAE